MTKTLKAQRLWVAESDLYEVQGEDEPIVTFNAGVIAEVDGVQYAHKIIFPGHVVDEEGINRMNRSRLEAYKLLNRIESAGNLIVLDHWVRLPDYTDGGEAC